jgi:hypothetical protein
MSKRKLIVPLTAKPWRRRGRFTAQQAIDTPGLRAFLAPRKGRVADAMPSALAADVEARRRPTVTTAAGLVIPGARRCRHRNRGRHGRPRGRQR